MVMALTAHDNRGEAPGSVTTSAESGNGEQVETHQPLIASKQ
jgi:hypothetical protein